MGSRVRSQVRWMRFEMVEHNSFCTRKYSSVKLHSKFKNSHTSIHTRVAVDNWGSIKINVDQNKVNITLFSHRRSQRTWVNRQLIVKILYSHKGRLYSHKINDNIFWRLDLVMFIHETEIKKRSMVSPIVSYINVRINFSFIYYRLMLWFV